MGGINILQPRNIPSEVAEHGITATQAKLEAMKTYTARGGTKTQLKQVQTSVREMGEAGLEILGSSPYAPGPTLLTRTPEEVELARKKKSTTRRRGRGRTITGALEPQTTKKALLG